MYIYTWHSRDRGRLDKKTGIERTCTLVTIYDQLSRFGIIFGKVVHKSIPPVYVDPWPARKVLALVRTVGEA